MGQTNSRKDYRPRSDRVPRVEPEESLAVGCHGFVGVPAISAHRYVLSPAQRDRTEPESGRPTCVISSGRSSQEPSEPVTGSRRLFSFAHISPRRCAMVADRIPNPCHEGSTPSTDAFFRYSRISARTIDNWTFIAFSPGSTTARETFPAAPPVRRGRRLGSPARTSRASPGTRPWGSQRPGDVTSCGPVARPPHLG